MSRERATRRLPLASVPLSGYKRAVEWAFDSSSEIDAHRLRREFMELLRKNGTGDFDAAELIYGELIGNAVRHAPGRITVRLDWRDDTPSLTVHDEGASFGEVTTLPDDPMSESGRGLYIVKQLACDLHIDDITADGSKITAVLPVHRAHA